MKIENQSKVEKEDIENWFNSIKNMRVKINPSKSTEIRKWYSDEYVYQKLGL